MKVKATAEYQKRNVLDKELGYIPAEGDVFEVTEERYNILNGNNAHNVVFVEKVEEEKEEMVEVKEEKKVVKKATPKKKK